jgi:hypothetical protein
LIRCAREGESAYELSLIKDIQVRIGGETYFLTIPEANMDRIDTTKPVYVITGSMVWSKCNTRSSVETFGQDPDLNCREMMVPQATGVCWLTLDADWKCTLGGDVVGEARQNMPPPRA